MATHQSQAVAPIRGGVSSVSGGAARRRGTCLRLTRHSRSTTMTVRLRGGDIDVALPAAPDMAMAQRLTGGMRRVSWVSIDVGREGVRCEVAGLSRRPQRVRLPLAAALALADAHVPTVVRLADRA
jgi:hypothetical protein